MIRYLAAAVIAAALAVPVHAGERPATAEEAAKVGAALTELGFTGWSKIEWDKDGKWEVDDAKHSDGKVYDLDLSAADLSILKKEIED